MTITVAQQAPIPTHDAEADDGDEGVETSFDLNLQ